MTFDKNKIICYVALLLLGACGNVSTEEFAAIEAASALAEQASVDSRELVLRPQEGLVYHQGQPFSGLSVRYYGDTSLAESIAYADGKKHGILRRWFPENGMSQEAHYLHGKRSGISKTWWENGKLRSESRFVKGKPQGVQKQWYLSGAPFKEQHLVDGSEEGMQRAWRENGALYVNYEARNGRIFGLKKAGLCYEIEDEMVQYVGD